MFTSFSDSCENLLTVVWGPRDEHVTHQAESLPTTVLQLTSSGGPFYPGGVEVGLLDMAALWLVLAPWFPQLCVVTGGSSCTHWTGTLHSPAPTRQSQSDFTHSPLRPSQLTLQSTRLCPVRTSSVDRVDHFSYSSCGGYLQCGVHSYLRSPTAPPLSTTHSAVHHSLYTLYTLYTTQYQLAPLRGSCRPLHSPRSTHSHRTSPCPQQKRSVQFP